MGDNLKDKMNQIGQQLKIGGSEVGQKLSARMSSMSFKIKEFFQGPSQTDNLIEEATSENLDEPDWATNLELCDMINHGRLNSVEFIRSVKTRIMSKSPRIQYLTLVLLETFVKNCEKAFSELAAERVLDEMVKLVEAPQTLDNNRTKALMLIETWAESSNELRCKETPKSLKSRGIRFPACNNESIGFLFTPPRSVAASESLQIPAQRFSAEQTKEALNVARNSIELLNTVLSSSPPENFQQDDLTITLSRQCREAQYSVQTIIETGGDSETLLFEALNVNDEIQKVLSKYEDMKETVWVPKEPRPVLVPVAVEPDDLGGAEDTRGGVRGRSSDETASVLSEAAESSEVKHPTKYDAVAN